MGKGFGNVAEPPGKDLSIVSAGNRNTGRLSPLVDIMGAERILFCGITIDIDDEEKETEGVVKKAISGEKAMDLGEI